MPPKQVSQKARAKFEENHLKNWQSKVTHGYKHRLISENPKVDEKLSTGWLQKSNLSSHMEGYILAIDEQEIVTKDTLKRREKDEVKKRVLTM